MPTLKIHYHHTDDCTPQKIFVNGKKEKKLKFEIAEGEPVKIQILNKIQSKNDQFYFVFFSFLDITTSMIRHFLDKNQRTFQSEYEIVLTNDAEIEIEPTDDGFIIAKHSESCQIISEKHEKEQISKRLLRMALAPFFILAAMLLLFLLSLGIAGLVNGNYTMSVTLFAITLALTLLFGFGLKQTFKK